ncbi:competence/damage-inducible protein A [Thiohalocapsa marina]|uniref:Competence/damage-inducible protein A n=1 Tax=Thiohalocapsa marina TaxID=424902 RepID=A0A5M8FJJ5_9GAMM|nr:molybdopterin-binding protein [Thiohalocapsa marina]KAA6185083.1 competence/damage-inducible protein A [Thiohalocapsa marina]
MPNPSVTNPSVTTGPIAFGLIVIGDEVLNGERIDKHLPSFKQLLADRGHELAWYWMLPDEPDLLTRQLRASMAGEHPVFCCGGIGATPDDHTRACAAAAANLALERHPEAAALIEGRFGADAYPDRILMAELPAGSALIPNPVNQVPGFAVGRHYFLPGFPQMAWPMATWVLDTHYGRAAGLNEQAVVVRGVPESRLIPLMRRLGEQYPEAKLFSLPHMGDDPHILLGFRGHCDLTAAMDALCAGLDQAGMAYEDRSLSRSMRA